MDVRPTARLQEDGDPGMMAARGAYADPAGRLPGEWLPLRGVHQNGRVVRLGDTYVMVDSGDLEHPTFDLVPANCARWGISVNDISALLVTHAHFDHASYAVALQRRGLSIVTNRAGAEALATVTTAPHMPSGMPRAVRRPDRDRWRGARDRWHVDPLLRGARARRPASSTRSVYGERLWFVGDMFPDRARPGVGRAC